MTKVEGDLSIAESFGRALHEVHNSLIMTQEAVQHTEYGAKRALIRQPKKDSNVFRLLAYSISE